MKAFLGIDVSKGYADFMLLNLHRQALEDTFQLDDTKKGHLALAALLEQLMKTHNISELQCAVESTGGLENNWYSFLVGLSKTKAIKVARLNPSGVKSNAQASLSRNITDSLSARYIAEYLIAQADKVDYTVQNTNYCSFRSIHTHIFLLKKQKTQLISQLKILLYSAQPELQRYCKESVPDWVLRLLELYSTANQLAKAKPEKLCKIKHITNQKATALIANAKQSIASRVDAHTGFLISNLASEILAKGQLIEKHKAYLTKECRGEEVTLLESIKGIGIYSAAAIMIEIEDIKRFSSAKALVSYFGLHPELKDSGDKKGTYHMSKKGRSRMRAILYMCANTAVIYDQHIKAIYHRHRSKGMRHNQAIGVIMHKLLRIIFGVLTTKTRYDNKVDQGNQQSKQLPKHADEKLVIERKRRFQPLGQDAPVSARQAKKRKAQQESQVLTIEEQVRDHPLCLMQS